MTTLHRYNEMFSVGAGAARRVPFGAKGLPDSSISFGDAYCVYNPQLKQNFVVKHGFATSYESTEFPESAGKPLCELLGVPLQNEGANGAGLSYQHFERGYLTWTAAEGVRLHVDTPIGDGFARLLPSELKALPTAANWGELYSVFNPRLKQRFEIIHGFAQVYGAQKEQLGLPLQNEQWEAPDGAIQKFERGILRWNPRDGITTEITGPAKLDVAANPQVGLRKLSLQDIAARSGGQLRTLRPPKLRIAPSPTGYLHIGNAWIAVINYLLAKKMGGEFILRIEDTDPLRSKPEYTEIIKESLSWLGLKWDGEIVFQSQRSELYRQKVDQLLAEGKAYTDPKSGAVYFKMPEGASIVAQDRVQGRVELPLADETGTRDFMLLRPDGSAMFLLANTVDDGEQQITHVVRGEGHLSNAARQLCLFKALGYPVPELYHLPHVVGEDGAKLSKREGASSVLDFKKRGIDPDVLLHHLAGLGMKKSPGDKVLSAEELIANFDKLGFAKQGSRIGFDKLFALQKSRIAALDSGELRKRLAGFDPEFMQSLGPVAAHALAEAVKNRASTYEEAIRIGKFVLAEPKYSERSAAADFGAAARGRVGELAQRLGDLSDWTLSKLRGVLTAFQAETGARGRDYAGAVQWALTGDTSGIPIENTLAILGKDRALARLKAVLAGQVELAAEHRAVEAPRVSKELLERPVIFDLTGKKLEVWINYPQVLGAPISESYQEPPFSNEWVQKFEHGIVHANGHVKLDGHDYWLIGGKLDGYLAHREELGAPIGEAYQNAEGAWVQDFERGQTDHLANVRFIDREGVPSG